MEHILFLNMIRADGIADPNPEHRFDPDRRWRFDYAWPSLMVAVEVEGGAFTRGRHTRGVGFVADLEKYSEAAVQGWIVIRRTPKQLPTPETLSLLHRAFLLRIENPHANR